MTHIAPIAPHGDHSTSRPKCSEAGDRRFNRAWLHPGTVLALLLCAAAAFGVWALLNRPVALADFHGRVAGLAFSPFQRGQSPEDARFPSKAEIRADLVQAAATAGRIRTYTVAGDMAEVPKLAADLPLKITLGAWLSADANANRKEITRLIATTKGAANVERVMVGNEVLLRGDLSAPALIADIARVRAALDLPVSTAEPWHVWLKHPELARAVDFITVHLLPYWEGQPADQAIAFTMNKLAEVRAAYPDKQIVIGEVGWPSNGVDIGPAHASRVNQAGFLRGFFRTAQRQHLDYYVMEAFDQPWKTSFEGRAAGYWGMFDLDRQAKWPMTGPVLEHPHWPGWAAGAVGLALLLAWGLLSRRPDIRVPGKLLLAGLAQGFVAALVCLMMVMSNTYLSLAAGAVWALLAAGQFLLLLLLLAGGFELAETIWARRWRRVPVLLPAPPQQAAGKVSIHIAICNEPPQMVTRTLDALAALDYPDFEVLVIDTDGVEKPQTSSGCSFLRFFPPRVHHPFVGALGPFDVVHFLVPDLLDPVVPSRSRLAILSRRASLQCHLAQLHRRERGPGKGVFRFPGQHVPDHHGQLAGGRHSRRGGSSFSLDAMKERPQRTGRRFCRPSRLHEHFAGTAIALLGDAPVACRLISRLTNLGCQSEVAAQLLRRRKACHVADRRQHRGRHDRAYPGNGHEAPGPWIIQGLLRQHLIEFCHLGADTLKLDHQAAEHGTLLVRQRQAVQPLASSLAEQVAGVFRDEVRVQDRLDAPLRANHLFENTHPLGHLAPPIERVLVGHPNLGQETCRVQASKDRGIDLVRLDASVGNRPHQARVCHRDTFDMRPHQPLNGGAVAGCFDDNLVLEAERLGEVHQRTADEINPQFPGDLSVLQDRHLSKRPMNVHTHDTHAVPPVVPGSQRACTTSTDPRSQRSRASRRGGHVTTRARSSWSGRPAAV
jgi:exo-beta-1,3-glucanase (GH17 family)